VANLIRRAARLALFQRSFLGKLLLIVAAATVLLTVPFLSGGPTIFSDTKAYYDLGQDISNEVLSQFAATASVRKPTQNDADRRLNFTVAGARSPTFSLYIYQIENLGGSWALLFIQSLISAFVIWNIVDRFGEFRYYGVIILALAVASSLPINIGFLMPDLFTGLSLLILMYILSGAIRYDLNSIFLVLIFVFGLTTHASNPIIAAIASVVLLIGTSVMRRGGGWLFSLRGFCLVWCSLAVSLGISVAYGSLAFAIGHQPLNSPPFLTARLVADGPGREYLSEACHQNPRAYALCAFRDRPLNNSNDFLWSRDPRAGVFEVANYETRLELIHEQTRFVMATAAYRPVELTTSIVRNAVALLFAFKIDESYADPTIYMRDKEFASIFSRLLPNGRACLTNASACKPNLDVRVLDALMLCGLLSSCVFLLALALLRKLTGIYAFGVVGAVTLVIVNATVCAALSGPFERYEARLIWILPLFALMGIGILIDARRPASKPVAGGIE
jgi:hypothetical protein